MLLLLLLHLDNTGNSCSLVETSFKLFLSAEAPVVVADRAESFFLHCSKWSRDTT